MNNSSHRQWFGFLDGPLLTRLVNAFGPAEIHSRPRAFGGQPKIGFAIANYSRFGTQTNPDHDGVDVRPLFVNDAAHEYHAEGGFWYLAGRFRYPPAGTRACWLHLVYPAQHQGSEGDAFSGPPERLYVK